jgi:hypothetical protein
MNPLRNRTPSNWREDPKAADKTATQLATVRPKSPKAPRNCATTNCFRYFGEAPNSRTSSKYRRSAEPSRTRRRPRFQLPSSARRRSSPASAMIPRATSNNTDASVLTGAPPCANAKSKSGPTMPHTMASHISVPRQWPVILSSNHRLARSTIRTTPRGARNRCGGPLGRVFGTNGLSGPSLLLLSGVSVEAVASATASSCSAACTGSSVSVVTNATPLACTPQRGQPTDVRSSLTARFTA